MVLERGSSFSGREEFRYARLENSSSFRLLHILSAGDDGLLSCTLSEFDINKSPGYVALSYCWGPGRDVEKCIVNGQVIAITVNLASALRQIRQDGNKDEEYLWADAICINQSDIEEKDTQIKHMPQIFAGAEKVISWLTRGDSECRALRNVQRFIDADCQLPDDRDGAYTTYLALMRAFVSLSQVDFWRRIWIVQEVCLAKDLVLTSLSARVSWQPFFRALTIHAGNPDSKHWLMQSKLHEYMTTHTMHLHELNALRGRISRREPMPLLQALYWTRRCEATYMKDKIFGLLGLVTDGWSPLQDLYYGDELEDVQRKITTAEMIDTTRGADDVGLRYRLDIITFTTFGNNWNEGSFSRWSPPWTDKGLWQRLRRWQVLRLDRVQLQLNATNPLNEPPTRGRNGALLAHGRSLGMIRSSSVNDGNFPYKSPGVFHAAATAVLDELQVYNRKGTITWKPRLRDATGEQMQPWKAVLDRYRRRLMQLIDSVTPEIEKQQGTPVKPEDLATANPEDQALYEEYRSQIRESLIFGSSLAHASSIWNFQRMRLYQTSQGWLGFGLFHGVPGDMVYLVEGLSVPVILRRYGSGLTARGFVVVGEIFTFGLMQGEYFAADDQRPLLKPWLKQNEREELHIF